MIRKITALVAAAALAATAVAPAASARDYYRHGDYGRHYYGRDHYRGDDAVAIGAVGLVLGLALGSALASAGNDRGCYDRCGYAPPPPPPQYRGYDPGRGGPPAPSNYRDGSAYEEDYGIDPKLDGGPEAQSCVHQQRQWDRYANRYVTVDVPC